MAGSENRGANVSGEAGRAGADPGSASLSPSARSESGELRGLAGAPEAAGGRIAKVQDQLSAPGTSSRAKYAALVVGRPGLGALLKYELVISLAQARAGALGLVLRKMLYPALLGSCGRNVVFGQNVVLRHPHKIAIGSNVVIDDNCLIDAKGESNRGVRIGDGVFIGRNTILSCKNGDIELADGANIGFNCEVFSASRVTIGRSVLMAAYCYVIGGDHDFSDPSKPVLEQTRTSAGVTIGDGVWMGAGAKILDGVAIGDGAVIGAGAVVRENVPASAIAVGIPARVVSTR
jgi:acetyltransferase-like isoleucine patch superfamily enzyme